MTKARTNNQRLVQSIFANLKVREPPTPLVKIANYLKYQIKSFPFPDELSGVHVSNVGGGVIGVNRLHHIHRQRFTVAHELAHFMLGHTINQSPQENYLGRSFNKYSPEDIQENESDSLAAELLMPRHFLEKDCSTCMFDQLVERYQVSPQAMTIRLEKTKLFPKD